MRDTLNGSCLELVEATSITWYRLTVINKVVFGISLRHFTAHKLFILGFDSVQVKKTKITKINNNLKVKTDNDA